MIKAILIGFGIAVIIKVISLSVEESETKRKIKTLGFIICKRCSYKGKPIAGGENYEKIVCPACNSDNWEKIEE